MCEHGRGLDGRTVARGRHRQSGELRLGRRRGRGLRGARVRVQARLGRRKGWEDGQADGPNRAKITRFWLVIIIMLLWARNISTEPECLSSEPVCATKHHTIEPQHLHTKPRQVRNASLWNQDISAIEPVRAP